MEFKPSRADTCLYYRKTGQSETVLACYVDDCLLACQSEQEANDIIRQLEEQFQIKRLGQVKNYLGIQIERNDQGFTFCQSDKIKQLLEKWNMLDCKPTQTPMVADERGKQNASEMAVACDAEQFQSLLGSLLHISIFTRPDVAYSVGKLARSASNPTHAEWIALKRILRYLKGTMDVKLKIYPQAPLLLECYADASFASSDDRKSVSGYVMSLCGVPVDWRSKLQSLLALSATESEYISVSYLITQLIWMRQLLEDIGINQKGPIRIWEDNQACIQLSRSERTQGPAKHVDIRYQNVRDAVQRGEVTLIFCPSEQNAADVLTKPLAREKFQKGVQMLMLE